MSHMNTLMPHPVLRPNGLDYNAGCSFSMDITRSQILSRRMIIGIRYNLISNAVNGLIESKKAKYCAVITCTRTYTRCIHSGTDPNVNLDLDPSQYAGTLLITPYVIATTDVEDFRSEEHDDELKTDGGPMVLPVGCIVAVGDTHEIDLSKPPGYIGSAIKLVPKSNIEKGFYEIGTDQDYLQIELHKDTYEDVKKLRKSAPELLYPSLYLTALEHGMRYLRDSGENQDRAWVRSLIDTLEKNRIEIDFNTEVPEMHRHSQKLLYGPLGKMIEWHMRQVDEND